MLLTKITNNSIRSTKIKKIIKEEDWNQQLMKVLFIKV